MFENCGKKLKRLAKINFITATAYAVVVGIVAVFQICQLGDSAKIVGTVSLKMAANMVVLIFGSWVVSLLLHAVGEIAESCNAQNRNSDEIITLQKRALLGKSAVAKNTDDWKCSCGRTNKHYVSTCSCGKLKREVLLERKKLSALANEAAKQA